MNKLAAVVFLILLPIIGFAADSSLSFAPPPGDFSVVFLGNIFGIVDGVLHGTGSQIMGSMFAVFNAAVLALGGMIIMYTLIVSTMNTAHEGEMLGKQWSSMWIPIRSTIGLALLIPKASGYCVMQIFVMWIVVQGIGAADKVWDAALDYLNRGGAIIQAQANPADVLTQSGIGAMAKGSQAMLAGEVCMLGLQTQLQNQHQLYMNQKNANPPYGPCSGTPSDQMKGFCESTVPNFINTVNIVAKQNASPDQTDPYIIDMPNFDKNNALYAQLNGICGKISWNPFQSQLDVVKKNIQSVSDNDLATAKLSRAIALQQMYIDLSQVAQIMVNNNPGLASLQQQKNSSDNKNYAPFAKEQFGVARTTTGSVCNASGTPKCTIWGGATGTTSTPLFNGTEFQGALLDYNGVMQPALTLIQQAKDSQSANDSRKFIADASTRGWIMAGSYFFDLVRLNTQANRVGTQFDSNTGIDKTKIDISKITAPFTPGTTPSCTDTYTSLCIWLGKDVTKVNPIVQLINGTGVITPIMEPDISSPHNVIDNIGSSTVYGFTNNSTILQLPGQPGLAPLQFANLIQVSVDTQVYQLPSLDFPCWRFIICWGDVLGDVIYNIVIRNLYNSLLQVFGVFINKVINAFLVIPLTGIADIFKHGLQIIEQPNVNPIVALAQMGTYYINFAANMWISLIMLAITSAILPFIGIFIMPFVMMTLPLLAAWLGTMVGIGMTTAYYVPMLPYMIFTFGAIAWIMAVIEAMVSAPIVALGVTHPEGHEAFGKGEHAILILMNIFLRPSMMIIGYIAAIALSYVSVWIINAGFDNAIAFIQGGAAYGTLMQDSYNLEEPTAGSISGGYSGWAGIYAYFFSILIYTSMYLTVVTKAFTLISVLPDKVLRWIGSHGETFSTDAAQWAEDTKGKVEKAGDDTKMAQAAVGKKQQAFTQEVGGKAKEKFNKLRGGGVGASGSDGPSSTPSGGE